ncbi:MAG: conjugal transfer protein TraH [Sulfurimonas sp.]|jgi:hypothetical protein
MNKKIISMIAATFLMSVPVHPAGIDSFLNDALMVDSSGAGTVKTDTGTLMYGGKYEMRAKSVSIHPLSIQAPSLKMGCGGISASLGSLSFLGEDQIVDLMNGMMANAPGVMFQMALKVICPSCMDTLNALEELTNQINNMTLDSCAMTKQMAGGLESLAKSHMDTGTAKDGFINMNGINKSIRSTAQDVADINQMLSGEGCVPTDKACGAKFFMDSTLTETSYLRYIIKDDIVDDDFNDDNLINVLRYFTGDLKVTRPTGTGDAKTHGSIKELGKQHGSHYNEKVSIYETGSTTVLNKNTENIFKYLIGDTNSSQPYVLDKDGYRVLMSNTGTNLLATYTTKLTNIANKMSIRGALTKDDIKFLGMFKIPIYQILNRFASMPSGNAVFVSLIPSLAKMLTYELVYEFLSKTSSFATSAKAKNNETTFKKINYDCSAAGCYYDITAILNAMSTGANNASIIAYELAAAANKEATTQLTAKSDLFASVNAMAQYTLQRSNPQMFESYMFSGTLTH